MTDYNSQDTDRDAEVIPEDREELHIGRNGLWIPPELRDFERQVVIRTPRATLQHFGSEPLEPYYEMVDESHFGEEEKISDPSNPELVPDEVSIKRQGEPVETFSVETDPSGIV